MIVCVFQQYKFIAQYLRKISLYNSAQIVKPTIRYIVSNFENYSIIRFKIMTIKTTLGEFLALFACQSVPFGLRPRLYPFGYL